MITFLYVEEAENDFVNSLVLRQDIRLIIIRFLGRLNFTSAHLEHTSNIPVFLIDRKNGVQNESQRLRTFLSQCCDHIDVFFNDSEFNQVFIQNVAWELGLPGALSPKQADLVRDKIHMKEFARSIGIACPEFCQISSKKDLLMLEDRWGFPIIVKWKTGVSSIEVYKIKTREEIESLDIDLSSGKYMAEQYVRDRIWCVDAIVLRGQVVQNFVTWLPYPNLDFAVDKKRFTHLAFGKQPSFWKFEPKTITQTIISGLQLFSSGYLHLELFVNAEGWPTLCEFAWRTPGDHMLRNFSYLFGIDVQNYLIDALLGKKVQEILPRDDFVAEVLLPMREGRIKRISSYDELKSKCNLIDGYIRYASGNIIHSVQNYSDCSGWVELHATSLEDALESIQRVYNSFSLITEVSNEQSSISN